MTHLSISAAEFDPEDPKGDVEYLSDDPRDEERDADLVHNLFDSLSDDYRELDDDDLLEIEYIDETIGYKG